MFPAKRKLVEKYGRYNRLHTHTHTQNGIYIIDFKITRDCHIETIKENCQPKITLSTNYKWFLQAVFTGQYKLM